MSTQRSQERRAKFRSIATEFVNSINENTVCVNCGAQPVEWHHPDHPRHPNARVSSLRTQGASIARIQVEIDRCEPFCRSCHMAEDGRLAVLAAGGPYKKGVTYTDPRPCIQCGKLTKPTRRDRCCHCYLKFMGIR